jgi:hypothetical protein
VRLRGLAGASASSQAENSQKTTEKPERSVSAGGANAMSYVDYTTLIRDLLIDLVSVYFVTYVILYRKFQNIEMFVACALFNIFIMLIVMAIIRTDFNIAVGFGLFALLSLIQVRSAQFTKTETAYILGSVALAVINGAGITDLSFVLICNFVVIVAAWLFGTWSLEHSTNLITVDYVRKMTVTLDHIDEELVADRTLMKGKLAQMLGSQIQSFEIKKLDYVRDIVEVSVVYELPPGEKVQYAKDADAENFQGATLASVDGR